MIPDAVLPFSEYVFFINDSKTADGEAGRRISGVFFSVNEKNGKRM